MITSKIGEMYRSNWRIHQVKNSKIFVIIRPWYWFHNNVFLNNQSKSSQLWISIVNTLNVVIYSSRFKKIRTSKPPKLRSHPWCMIYEFVIYAYNIIFLSFPIDDSRHINDKLVMESIVDWVNFLWSLNIVSSINKNIVCVNFISKSVWNGAVIIFHDKWKRSSCWMAKWDWRQTQNKSSSYRRIMKNSHYVVSKG